MSDDLDKNNHMRNGELEGQNSEEEERIFRTGLGKISIRREKKNADLMENQLFQTRQA